MKILIFITTCLCLNLVYTNGDTNEVFQPCADTLVQRKDGFTLGIAFASFNSFFINKSIALSPCDQRLSMHTKNSQLAVFRPKVDQISLLTINTTKDTIQGGTMVAFAGSKYAAISSPQFVFDEKLIVTSFTLVLHFEEGRLVYLLWKNYGCKSCKEVTPYVCYNGETCAMNIRECRSHGGNSDCVIGLQIAFSGTDKYSSTLKSWYEVNKLHQYSLFGLYSNLKDDTI